MPGVDELAAGTAAAGIISSLLDSGSKLAGSTSRKNTKFKGSSRSEVEASLSGENRDRLDISDEAVDKIVTDILKGPDGLASIFAGEQNAGVFNSSVSAQAAGDLTAKISGEIAKLRAERVQTENRTQVQTESTEQEQQTKQKDSNDGLIRQIFG